MVFEADEQPHEETMAALRASFEASKAQRTRGSVVNAVLIQEAQRLRTALIAIRELVSDTDGNWLGPDDFDGLAGCIQEVLLGPDVLNSHLASGCSGQHHGSGAPACPTQLHHHHDEKCES